MTMNGVAGPSPSVGSPAESGGTKRSARYALPSRSSPTFSQLNRLALFGDLSRHEYPAIAGCHPISGHDDRVSLTNVHPVLPEKTGRPEARKNRIRSRYEPDLHHGCVRRGSGHICVGILKAALEIVGLAGGPVRGPGNDLTAVNGELFEHCWPRSACCSRQTLRTISVPGKTAGSGADSTGRGDNILNAYRI